MTGSYCGGHHLDSDFSPMDLIHPLQPRTPMPRRANGHFPFVDLALDAEPLQLPPARGDAQVALGLVILATGGADLDRRVLLGAVVGGSR
jgi:hypothetical protein